MRYARWMVFAACLTLFASPSVADAINNPPTDNTKRLAEITTYFDSVALASQPDLVECTLSGKAQTTCLRITVTLPPDVSTGPWCPRNVADGPDSSGIWINDDTVYDADGAFVANLATFYDDPVWQLFDPETGNVRVTETKEACEAAARPDVDPDYNNYCVECLTSYIDPGTTQTYVIPLSPV
ncbi:MAG: hypothetical protein GY788_02420, partial [bacterium]|nr:hypothetical protein [bacterium]